MEQIDVWFTVSEVQGIVKSGGLADVAKALPQSLQELGHHVRVVLPGYRQIPNREQAEVVLDTELSHWPHTEYKIRQTQVEGIAIYFVECEKYFDRADLYGEHNRAYADNGERFAFFSAACLDALPKLNIQPDIIHANDWHTGLVPFLLKTRYKKDGFFANIKSILTIHNALFKGIFSYDEMTIIPELHLAEYEDLQYGPGYISMLRAGIAFADKINSVSPNYASELLTPLGAHGLVDDFVRRAKDLYGILNGCDYTQWNPETDDLLAENYSAERSSVSIGKAANKELLQSELQLPERDVPMFGMVCRLTQQKGFHYLLPILESFLRNDVQVVIVGTGEPEIANQLHQIAAKYPHKFAFIDGYSNRYAHLVEAAADFFLMPSEFEACGLNQIYSMAYGTLPIVRAVGGLKDTVTDYDRNRGDATGFSFSEPSAAGLLICMQRALLFYLQSPEEYEVVQLRGMHQRFEWRDSAKEYVKMYQSARLDLMM